MTSISIENLNIRFARNTKPALENLTLDIASGECVALLGPSGSGKTTVLRLVAGLLDPDSGDIKFNGRTVLQRKPEDRNAVMVFQNHLLFPHLSVHENIAFGLRMRGHERNEINRRVADLLRLMQLPELSNRMPFELSGGQQQRTALARALILKPSVLLLDEPLSNLDEHMRVEMRELIHKLQRDLQVTTVFVTHDQEEAVALGDRIALIFDGQLDQFSTPVEFFDSPNSERGARFFGGQNFITGEVQGQTFSSPLGNLKLAHALPNGLGKMTFRPESVRMGKARDNARLSTLVSKVFRGAHTELKFTCREVLISASVHPNVTETLHVGENYVINIPPASISVLRG